MICKQRTNPNQVSTLPQIVITLINEHKFQNRVISIMTIQKVINNTTGFTLAFNMRFVICNPLLKISSDLLILEIFLVANERNEVPATKKFRQQSHRLAEHLKQPILSLTTLSLYGFDMVPIALSNYRYIYISKTH